MHCRPLPLFGRVCGPTYECPALRCMRHRVRLRSELRRRPLRGAPLSRMEKALRGVALMALLASSSCAAQRTAEGPTGPAPLDQPEALVQMTRGACVAHCPVYQVAIFSDGAVIYEGQQSVGVIGVRQKSIPSASLQEIIERFEKVHFVDLPEHCCDQKSTRDCPSVTIAYGVGRARRILEHGQCSDGAPAELTDLEGRIDELVGVAKWTSVPGGVAAR